MIVVDTSVWIDVLNDTDSRPARRFTDLLRDDAPLALTDVILTEILQGLRSDREATQVEDALGAFPMLTLSWPEDFRLAAALYRTARRSGITVRKTLDCLIAAPCVRTGSSILHADADFDRLARCTDLLVFAG